MFAKLSVLALFVLHVSTLDIVAPEYGHENTDVTLRLYTTGSDDPSRVNLRLTALDSPSDTYPVAQNVNVRSSVDVRVKLPIVRNPGREYEFVATDIDNPSRHYVSNPITVGY